MIIHRFKDLNRFHRDRRGATMLEWALLLGAIGLPSYFIIRVTLNTLIAHYQMMTMINSMPIP